MVEVEFFLQLQSLKPWKKIIENKRKEILHSDSEQDSKIVIRDVRTKLLSREKGKVQNEMKCLIKKLTWCEMFDQNVYLV